MSEIVVEGLHKTFRGRPPVPAVADVSFTVAEGELLVLLGPSGCGKTTTLRALAGLEQPDEGTIRFGDRWIFSAKEKINVPPQRRDIGLVFQSFALWPHRTAAQNIAFPLKARRVDRASAAQAVAEVARLLDLDDTLLRKRPGQLSGGQQQRVALGRALVAQPKVVLFDEPLSNLDALLREQLRLELRELHQRLGFTGVYVTHDLQEALALGDRVVVMQKGEIRQIGTPGDVFGEPATPDVARLLGFRPVATLRRDGAAWRSDDGPVTGAIAPTAGAPDELRVYARPEQLLLVASPQPKSPRLGIGNARVVQVFTAGSRCEAVVAIGDKRLHVVGTAEQVGHVCGGDTVTVEVAAADARYFDSTGERWAPGNGRGGKAPTAEDDALAFESAG